MSSNRLWEVTSLSRLPWAFDARSRNRQRELLVLSLPSAFVLTLNTVIKYVTAFLPTLLCNRAGPQMHAGDVQFCDAINNYVIPEVATCYRSEIMGIVGLLLCSAAFAAAAHGLDYQNDHEFMHWLSRYHDIRSDPGKIYPSWKKNAEFVKQHNAEGHSYTLSLNKFAHLVSAVLCYLADS